MYEIVLPTGEEVVLLDVCKHVKFEEQLNPAEQGGANALANNEH